LLLFHIGYNILSMFQSLLFDCYLTLQTLCSRLFRPTLLWSQPFKPEHLHIADVNWSCLRISMTTSTGYSTWSSTTRDHHQLRRRRNRVRTFSKRYMTHKSCFYKTRQVLPNGRQQTSALGCCRKLGWGDNLCALFTVRSL
jgi:hypothetical protein